MRLTFIREIPKEQQLLKHIRSPNDKLVTYTNLMRSIHHSYFLTIIHVRY